MVADFPRVHRPCQECPWKVDAEAGKFPTCRYEQLTATAGAPGAEVWLDAPIFACHKSPEGGERACAGWLATVGRDHLGIRMAVITGRLDPVALDPGEGWPELHPTYAAMAIANGVDPDDPTLRRCR